MYRWSVAIVTGRGHVAGSRMRLSKKVLALRDQISVKSRDANTATLLYETQYGSQALYPHLLVSACLQPYTVGATGDKNSASQVNFVVNFLSKRIYLYTYHEVI